MCGICGKFNYKHLSHIEPGTIEAMRDQMIHRGPDDSGLYLNDYIGLGFRRLTIIDQATGNQPISNETGDIRIVANGEIYNYKELRSDLKSKGHIFKTEGDIEALLHAYEEYGPDLFPKINGIFGLSIWDARLQRLTVARDSAGVKPLYYGINSQGISFGSELKSLFPDNDMDFIIDHEALAFYFTFNYIPDPLSVFQSVRKLLPGHILTCDRSGISIQKFCDISINESKESAHEERFLTTLEDAARRQLMSDLPVGALLSGGIDSSAISMLYAKHYRGRLHTFSAGFREKTYDETPYAVEMADFLGTEHHTIHIDETIVDMAPQLVSAFDEPFADSSMLPLYAVSDLAKKFVKVLLVGDGCDELMAGYETYIADRILKSYSKIPETLRKHFIRLSSLIPPSYDKVSFEQKLKRFLRYGRKESPLHSHALWRCIIDNEELPLLLSKQSYQHLNSADISGMVDGISGEYNLGNSTNDFCFFDFRHYLPSDMLVKVDRMTMLNSIEARPVFLDQEFVRYAFTIPSKYKLKNFTTKWLMKRALKGSLPDSIIRRSKKGFNTPLAHWFKERSLSNLLLNHICSDQELSLFFREEYILKLLKEHLNRKCDNSAKLWNILVFYIWYIEVFRKIPAMRNRIKYNL